MALERGRKAAALLMQRPKETTSDPAAVSV